MPRGSLRRCAGMSRVDDVGELLVAVEIVGDEWTDGSHRSRPRSDLFEYRLHQSASDTLASMLRKHFGMHQCVPIRVQVVVGQFTNRLPASIEPEPRRICAVQQFLGHQSLSPTGL